MRAQMETLLNAITGIHSLETLQEARREFDRVAQRYENTQHIYRTASANLVAVEEKFAEQAATLLVFRAMDEVWLIVRDGECLQATAGALRFFALSERPKIKNPEFQRLLAHITTPNAKSRPWRTKAGQACRVTSRDFSGTLLINVVVEENETHETGVCLEARRRGLSPRQVEIVSLLAQGHSDKMIAAGLKCSIHTVRSHVRSIIEKLNVSGRHEALALLRVND